MNFIVNIMSRLKAFTDKSAWILIVMGAVILGIVDFEMLTTLVKWTSFVLIAGGGTIFFSKIFFPTVKFSELIPLIKSGNIAAAIIVAAVILFSAMSFYTVVFWAK